MRQLAQSHAVTLQNLRSSYFDTRVVLQPEAIVANGPVTLDSVQLMSKRDQYYFGTLIKQIDVFAFPRTGSHLSAYCFNGLFDSVSLLPEALRTSPEPISRQR